MGERNNEIFRSLKRFFSGKKSEEGKRIYNYWFNSFDDSRGYLDQLSQEEQKEYKKRLLDSIQEKIDETKTNPLHSVVTNKHKWPMLYRVAAILLIVSVLSFSVMRISNFYDSGKEQIATVQKLNYTGQISKFTLPDGSQVWLGTASTLKYPEKFSDGKRVVNLDGEAYFEVTHDSSHPFIVKSDLFSTRVLGTSFNVKAYRNDPDKEVTLATGSVEVFVEERGQKKVLKPNQQVSFQRGSGLSKIRKVNASLVSAWTHKELVFMRESFANIARTFERWYGVEFVFKDENLKEEVFVYHFKELSLQNSLTVLKELADFEYLIEGKTVFIKKSKK